jgi:hypothetical protein
MSTLPLSEPVELVPGGATDSLWMMAAHHLAPHMETTRSRGWVEGFVAALEVLRGIGNEPLADVLRESLRLDLELGEYPD